MERGSLFLVRVATGLKGVDERRVRVVNGPVKAEASGDSDTFLTLCMEGGSFGVLLDASTVANLLAAWTKSESTWNASLLSSAFFSSDLGDTLYEKFVVS